MSMDFIGLSVGMGYTDETVIGGGALKGKNCVVSNIKEVADGVKVTFQWTLDDGTVQTETIFIPRGTQGEDGVDGKSAYEIWLEAGNTGTEQDFLISLVGEKGADGKSAYQYAQDGGYIGTETEFTTNIARSGVISKELEVERARIDNLTTLQDGSTTGDAELIDARVDYNGITHENLGSHIRKVTKNINNDLIGFELNTGLLSIGKKDNDTILFDSNTISSGITLKYDFTRNPGEVGCIAFKDEEGNILNYIGSVSSVGGDTNYHGTITIPENYSKAVALSSNNHIENAFIFINKLEYENIRFAEKEEFKKVENTILKPLNLKYIHGNISGNPVTANYGDTNFMLSSFIESDENGIQINIADGWTVFIIECDDMSGICHDTIGWKTESLHWFGNKKYIRLLVSTVGYSTPINADNVRENIKVIGVPKSVFTDKCYIAVGDSITYGTSPLDNSQIDNPWCFQVAEKLNMGIVINNGVASSGVLPSPRPNTPPAIWSQHYNLIPEEGDIISIMIGINDLVGYKNNFAGYVLGTMEDRTTDTFYGALHTMWLGLIERFSLSNGKKLFMINYPKSDVFNNDEWNEWIGATIKVANHYSIPICDLSTELGISQDGDVNNEYWILTSNGTKNVHPTQTLANQFSIKVANFIKSHFYID